MTHRFYIGDLKDSSGPMELREHVWLNKKSIVNQLTRVLRVRSGEEIVLFDGRGHERLYKIGTIEPLSIELFRVTDFAPKLPRRSVSLAWSLLKKDKNELVIQKCTELGVQRFLPIYSDRTEKKGFDSERMCTIAIEAVEQCGRHDIPEIHEAQGLVDVLRQYKATHDIYVTDMDGDTLPADAQRPVVLFVGPEGGWSDKERELFKEENLTTIAMHDFTLRAETASITIVAQLLG